MVRHRAFDPKARRAGASDSLQYVSVDGIAVGYSFPNILTVYQCHLRYLRRRALH